MRWFIVMWATLVALFTAATPARATHDECFARGAEQARFGCEQMPVSPSGRR